MDESYATQDFAGDKTQPTAETLALLSQNNSANIKMEPDSSSTSEFDALFSKLTNESPHDPDGWRRLISLATSSGEIPKIQRTYDELLKHYPNTVRVLQPLYQ
jgi:cleavage stimulation factor subunit 3